MIWYGRKNGRAEVMLWLVPAPCDLWRISCDLSFLIHENKVLEDLYYPLKWFSVLCLPHKASGNIVHEWMCSNLEATALWTGALLVSSAWVRVSTANIRCFRKTFSMFPVLSLSFGPRHVLISSKRNLSQSSTSASLNLRLNPENLPE